MATVNRYDTPIASEFINTYVPIPFEQLYQLGTSAKQDVSNAMNQLSTTLDKWSDFRSPSDLDTQAWYDETIGRAQPIVERLASNPDLLKSAAGRAELYGVLNNVDRSKLSSLMQSRDTLEARQKMNQQLVLAGKYNPLWHDVDFSNYNTLQDGIFNDVAPTAYTSVQDLIDPYVASIPDGFIRNDGMYNWSGVTEDRVRQVLDRNIGTVLTTPEAQEHINAYLRQNPDATENEAIEWFKQTATNYSLNKYVRENPDADPFAKIRYQESLRLASKKGKKETEPANPATLTDMLKVDGDTKIQQNIINRPNAFPNSTSAWANFNPNGGERERARFSKALGTAFKEDANIQFQQGAGLSADDKNLTTEDYWNGINNVLDNFTSDVPKSAADIVLAAGSTGSVNTVNGEQFVYNSTAGLRLPSTQIANLMGVKAPTTKNRSRSGFLSRETREFEKDLENGRFKNVRVQSTGRQLTYVQDGQVKSGIIATVEIPASELDRRGYDLDYFSLFPWNIGLDSFRNSAEQIGGYISEDDNQNEVLRLEVIRDIPNEGTTTSWINQEYLNSQTSKTYSNKQYERNQEIGFNVDDYAF